jgi:hypothetical protein
MDRHFAKRFGISSNGFGVSMNGSAKRRRFRDLDVSSSRQEIARLPGHSRVNSWLKDVTECFLNLISEYYTLIQPFAHNFHWLRQGMMWDRESKAFLKRRVAAIPSSFKELDEQI